jgi:hypothetical protein
VLSLVIAASAVLLIGLSIPLVRRKVRPNRVYGFRTPSTLRDPQLWYEVNARTGVDLLVVGIGLLAIAVGHVLEVLSTSAFLALSVAWITAGAVVSVVHGFAIIGPKRS